MKEEEKKLAIEIISQSNQPKVSFRVPVKRHFSNIHEILIHECNADLINKLLAHGFSLSMCKKGLTVEKY